MSAEASLGYLHRTHIPSTEGHGVQSYHRSQCEMRGHIPLYVTVFKCLALRVAREIMSGHSRLLVNLWTKSFQRQFFSADPPVPITFIAIHRGGVDTFSSTWPFPKFWEPLWG
jgi:hypothetical protein